MHRAVKAHFPSLSSKTMEVAVEGEGEKETAGNKTIRVWPNNGKCGTVKTDMQPTPSPPPLSLSLLSLP